MKKIIYTSLILAIFLLNTNNGFAITNTHSADLEKNSSQYFSIADASQSGLDLSGDFTIEAWVKLESLPSSSGTDFGIVAKNDFTGGSNRAYRFTITPANELQAYVSQDGGSTNTTHAKTNSAAFASEDLGKWIHVAVSFSLSGRSYVFYKNGNVVASTNSSVGTTNAINNNAVDFTIGRDDTSGRYFDGLIDEVRVWNDVRTQSEVEDNMLESLSGSESNLVGYWALDDVLTDATSNNNHLTNNGSALFSEEPANVISCTLDIDAIFSGSSENFLSCTWGLF